MRTWDLWQRQGAAGAAIDLEHYEATGGMHAALSRHADEVFDSLPSETHRLAAARIFKALTERGADGRGIRRPLRLKALEPIAGAEKYVTREVIDAYRAPGVTFLMPPASAGLADDSVIDVSHESLMRVWDRLRTWVEEEAQSARIYRRLHETAALHSEKRAGLYHDPDLQIALSWREQTGPNAAWAELYDGGFDAAMRFLDQSREAAQREEKEREAARQRELERAQKFAEAQAKVARLFKRFAGSLAVGLCLAVALTVWAFKLRQEAKRQEATAQQQRQLAQEKEREALQQQQRAELSEASTATLLYGANLNLAQISFEDSNPAMTQRLLDQTRSHADRGFEWYYWQREMHRSTRILRGHAGAVQRVAFSPDGRRILTQGEDQVIIIRDAASGEEQLRVTAGKFLQFSPDGERLLCTTIFLPKTGIQVRSASTGAELTSTDLVSLGAFTPDGKQFATVRGERAVFRDAVTGKELSSFKAFNHYVQWYVNPIAFSPDGRWMLNGHSALHGGRPSMMR